MNEGRNANKPQRGWSRPPPTSQRKNPRPDGSGRHRQISANAEKSYHSYMALAREAASKGDTISAENFYQHAEHFLRLLKEPSS
jgi:Domain of unknown function (DUF4167)